MTYLLSLGSGLMGVSPLLFCMFENIRNLESENLILFAEYLLCAGQLCLLLDICSF